MTSEELLAKWLVGKIDDAHLSTCGIDLDMPVEVYWEDSPPFCDTCDYGRESTLTYHVMCRCGRGFVGDLGTDYSLNTVLAEVLT